MEVPEATKRVLILWCSVTLSCGVLKEVSTLGKVCSQLERVYGDLFQGTQTTLGSVYQEVGGQGMTVNTEIGIL